MISYRMMVRDFLSRDEIQLCSPSSKKIYFQSIHTTPQTSPILATKKTLFEELAVNSF